MTIYALDYQARDLPVRRRNKLSRHEFPACAVSGKARYRDQGQARDALTGMRWARLTAEALGIESRRRETRTYPCGLCGGWHVTSQPLRIA